MLCAEIILNLYRQAIYDAERKQGGCI